MVMHKDMPVAALRRCAGSRCMDISDCIAKSCLPLGQIVSLCMYYEADAPMRAVS